MKPANLTHDEWNELQKGELWDKTPAQLVAIEKDYLAKQEEYYLQRISRRAYVSMYSLEQIIVSYLLNQDEDNFNRAIRVISPEWFSDEDTYFDSGSRLRVIPMKGAASKIFRAITRIKDNRESPLFFRKVAEDSGLPLSVVIDIREAAHWIHSFAQFVEHAKALNELFCARQLQIVSDQIQQGTITNPLELKRLADNIKFPAQVDQGEDIIDLQMEILKEEERAYSYKRRGEVDPSLFFYGIENIDHNIGGALPGDFIILGARPGMGKSSFLRQYAKYHSSKRPVLYFTSEESKKRMLTLYAFNYGEINTLKLRSKNYEPTDFSKMQRGLSRAGQLFIPKGMLAPKKGMRISYVGDIDQMLTEISIFCAEAATTPLIIIDYIQLCSTRNGRSMNEKMTYVGQELERAARTNDCVIIAGSQLSRAVENRGGDRIPVLSDLRESGTLEQSAAYVLFLHRPEYYGIETDEEGNSTLGLCNIKIGKARGGGEGLLLKTQFIKEYGGHFSTWNNGMNLSDSINNSQALGGGEASVDFSYFETDTYEEENPTF